MGKFVVFVVIFLYGILSFLISLIRDFFDIFKMDITQIDKEYLIEKFLSVDTYKSMFVNDQLTYLGWVMIILFIFFSFADINKIKARSKYKLKSEYGSHGTARFQTEKEVKSKYTKDQLGWFLGGVFKDEKYLKNESYKLDIDGVYHSVNSGLNMQVNVVGTPGSMKTTGFILPNLFHLPYIYKKSNINEMPDLIVTDPKMEVYQYTAKYYEQQGYDVFVLDFLNFKYGDSVNILDYVDNDKDIMDIAFNYIMSVEGTYNNNKSEDGFWTDQEIQLFSALIGFVMQTKNKDKRNLTEVAKLLSDPEVRDVNLSQFLFKKNNIQGASLQLWNNFLTLAESERTRANIVGGLANKLKLFALDDVQALTNTSTVDFTRYGLKKERPMILYIFISDKDKTFSPLISVVINILLNQMYKTAERTESRLPNPVYVLLDEMANIGKLGNLTDKTGSMRGRRIFPMFIWQSLAQMKQRYTEWEDILGNCDSHIYLGLNEKFSSEYVSNTLGLTTVETQGINRTPRRLQEEQKSESINSTQRKLMFPDELKRLPREILIVSQGGSNPYKLKKIQYKYWDDKYRIVDKYSLDETRLLKKQNESMSFKNLEIVNDITDENLIRNDSLKKRDSKTLRDKINLNLKESKNPFKYR
ncbi:MAG: VirD4-like conjugal transfer protein, CD1115 family [Vulcanibacillus sp.]